MALGQRGAWRSIVLAVSVVLAGCGGGERPAAPAARGGPAGPAAASSGSPTTPAGQAAGGGAGASGPPAASGAASGPPAAAALQTLVEGARREGQLTLTWSENSLGGAEGARRWAEGFNRLYGLNVDVRF